MDSGVGLTGAGGRRRSGEDPHHDAVEDGVEDPGEGHDRDDEDDDDREVGPQLAGGRPHDLAELVDDLAEEQGDAREHQPAVLG